MHNEFAKFNNSINVQNNILSPSKMADVLQALLVLPERINETIKAADHILQNVRLTTSNLISDEIVTRLPLIGQDIANCVENI